MRGIAETPEEKPALSPKKNPTPGDYTICMVMYWSGARTDTENILLIL